MTPENPCRHGHPSFALKPVRGLFRRKYQNYWHCDQCGRSYDRHEVGRQAKVTQVEGKKSEGK